jgi:DNA-binding GntR family transcriptional regulator
MTETVRRQRRAKGDLAVALQGAADFHVRIAEMSGNARATRVIANLVDEVTRLHFLLPSLQSHIGSADEIRAHEQIAAAITTGDEKNAARLMRDHLATTHRILVEEFALPRRAAGV